VQPIHLGSDIPLIKKLWGKRGEYAYSFGSLVQSGAKVVFGSDTPVESFDPWKAIYTAIERKHDVDPSRESFYPQQTVGLDSALTAYTQNAAWAVHEENHLGTLTAGKFADMAIIDQDIFNSPSEILLNTRVLMTIQGGKIIYQDFDF
jgi:predicted amidohydrolase YtcJ